MNTISQEMIDPRIIELLQELLFGTNSLGSGQRKILEEQTLELLHDHLPDSVEQWTTSNSDRRSSRKSHISFLESWTQAESMVMITESDWEREFKPALRTPDGNIVWESPPRPFESELALLQLDGDWGEEILRTSGEENIWTRVHPTMSHGQVPITLSGMHYLDAVGYYVTARQWSEKYGYSKRIAVVDAIMELHDT